MYQEIAHLIPSVFKESYARNIKQSVRIRTTNPLDEDSPGVSKLGGTPGLPSATFWPRWNDMPLSFVGQLDLSDISAAGFQKDSSHPMLPATGMLFFFCTEGSWGNFLVDRGSARVIYYDGDPHNLSLAKIPDDLNKTAIYNPYSLEFKIEETLPPIESFYFTDYHGLPIYKQGLTPTQTRMLDRLDRRINQLYNSFDETRHRLGGHPDLIQGEMQWRCQMLAHGMESNKIDLNREDGLREGILDWQLLLQVDSDPKLGMDWGHRSEGSYYFWIRKQDLADRNFNYPWGILQTF